MEKNKIRELLNGIDYRRRSWFQDAFSLMGFTPGQPRILNRLRNGGEGLTQKELAEACQLDATTLSRALDRLEKDELITRTQGTNRRANLISLTDEGVSRSRIVRESYEQLDEILCRGFSEAELKTLMEGLERVCKNLEGSGNA